MLGWLQLDKYLIVLELIGMTNPVFVWDVSSAYDFFISLHVLHRPASFGLRAAWAAGTRSRLPQQPRKFLEQADNVLWIPFRWIADLPRHTTAPQILESLAVIPPEQRLTTLALNVDTDPELAAMLRSVAAQGRWQPADVELLRSHQKRRGAPSQKEDLENILGWWARPMEFGEQYLIALQIYYEVFFQEEQGRIEPALFHAVEQAQQLAQKLSLSDLLEELSQGVRFATETHKSQIWFAPSFWLSPLVIYGNLDDQRMMFLFGARPATASLITGEVIPDALLQSLKALADPTRLRILRYLQTQPLTPSELARRLRLRAPTVIHHLNELRLAGLVQLTLASPENRNDRRYTARRETLTHTFDLLKTFFAEEENWE